MHINKSGKMLIVSLPELNQGGKVKELITTPAARTRVRNQSRPVDTGAGHERVM
jgi:hypothetical protein